MPFRFRRGQISGGEARRIAREQIDRALGELEDESLDRDTQIHQARKRCKKLRGFLRLCRPALGEVFQRENRALRDAARLISGTRDRKVLLDTCRSLAANPGESAEPGAVDSVLEALEASYESHVQEGQEVEKKIESFKSRLRGVRRRIGKWPLDDLSANDLTRGQRKVYQQARKCMSACGKHPTVENFHEWRKRVKYYRYQLKLLRDFWKPVMEALRREAVKLSDDLGDDHDLAVLVEYLGENESGFDPDAVRFLKERAVHRRGRLQKKSFARGRRLLAQKAKSNERLMKAWMDVG